MSGYLIGRSFLNEYFKHGSVNIAYFLTKRATRIVPAYLIILIVYSLGSYFLEGEKFRAEYIFLIQNYLYRMPYFFASWALCIEAHFYIILPFLYRAPRIISTNGRSCGHKNAAMEAAAPENIKSTIDEFP